MEEFIKMATEQLGIGESATRSATAGILKIVKEQLGDSDFAELAGKLPGLDALLQGAPETGGGGGGLLGAAASMLGGKAGAALDLSNVLQQSGLDLEQGGSLMKLLVGFLKEQLGDSPIGKILDQLPLDGN